MARRRYRGVKLHVISDHGMADIGDTCNLMPEIDVLGLRMGHDYAAVYDSTMARFWFLKPGAREAITSFLREHPQGRLLREDELHAYGANFPDQRFGEAFFLLQPGTLLCPSHMGEKPIAGMHGYDPAHADSLATFASTEEPERAPRRLDDLFGVMQAEADRVSAGLGTGREVVRLPAPTDSASWSTTQLWDVAPAGPTWLCGVVRAAAGLFAIARGHLDLVGVTPRAPADVETLPAPLRAVYLQGRGGLVTEASVTLGPGASAEEQLAADLAYVVSRSARRDLGILMQATVS